MTDRLRDADRGASEVIGFVIIFALITSSVGLVTVVGFDGLESARDYEQVNNAERAFDVLADNVEDVTNRRAPSRATEIKLADAELRLDDPIVVNVTGVNTSDSSDTFSARYQSHPIVYDADTGTRIYYSSGALLRSQGDGNVMVAEPHFVLRTDRVVIPVIQTRSAGQSDVGGSTTVLVRTVHAGTELAAARSHGTYDVTVNVTTPRAAAWKRYMESKPDVTCAVDTTTTPETLSCELGGARNVYVTAVRVDVSLE